MFFQIAQPKTVDQFLARLSNVEQIQIRLAQNPDRLDHMRRNQFAADMVDQQTIVKAHAILIDRFRAHPETGGF